MDFARRGVHTLTCKLTPYLWQPVLGGGNWFCYLIPGSRKVRLPALVMIEELHDTTRHSQ